MQIIGYYLWRKNIKGNSNNIIEIKKMKRKQWIFLSIVFIIVWIFYFIFLKNIPQILKVVANITISADKEYIIDSLSSTLTITAVILTSKRYFE